MAVIFERRRITVSTSVVFVMGYPVKDVCIFPHLRLFLLCADVGLSLSLSARTCTHIHTVLNTHAWTHTERGRKGGRYTENESTKYNKSKMSIYTICVSCTLLEWENSRSRKCKTVLRQIMAASLLTTRFTIVNPVAASTFLVIIHLKQIFCPGLISPIIYI